MIDVKTIAVREDRASADKNNTADENLKSNWPYSYGFYAAKVPDSEQTKVKVAESEQMPEQTPKPETEQTSNFKVPENSPNRKGTIQTSRKIWRPKLPSEYIEPDDSPDVLEGMEIIYTTLGRDGVKHRLARILQDGYMTNGAAIRRQLSGEGMLVALELLTNSKLFWQELIQWMTNYHTEIVARSKAESKSCWILVTHCVRAMLTLIRGARSIGQRQDPAQMLWGTLQAHRIMAELIDHKFQGHPKISIILHQHLIDNAVPLTRFEEMEKTVAEMAKVVTASKAAADKASSVANKALTAAQKK